MEQSIEEIYTKMTQHEHVLNRPNTYIGSIKKDERLMWILDENERVFKQKEIEFVPGLYKCFDEILVNASDRTILDETCDEIRVNIDETINKITIYNNGIGIPIEIHKEYEMYVPEMLFGNLLTSSNYNDKKTRIVGGVNGIGAKACNIFSKFFSVETVDKNKKYYQEFTNNMFEKTEPVITKLDKKSKKTYTSISFIPDLERFGLKTLTNDIILLFKKRVYDIAACTQRKVKVYLNDELINIACFEDYIRMHQNSNPTNTIYEKMNDRWEIGFMYDKMETGFKQVSYVNSICTYQGGSHVEYITNQLTTKVIALIKNKSKDLNVKPTNVKENITIFIKSTIENPEFSSQSKETLTSKSSLFGSVCEITDKFIKEIAKTGFIDDIMELSKMKQMKELNKTDGKKKSVLLDVPKLVDAKWAGTRQASKCALFLTEGDSAKTLAINGISIIGRERYGVFPLKGKPLNVREATIEQIKNNEEVNNLKKILGLKHGTKYNTETERNKLRYGKIILLFDQDLDGSHIKGLLINAFHHFWKDLLLNGFIEIMSTPIVKIYNANDNKRMNALQTFYTLQDYQNWEKEQGASIKKYKQKYYKGLGTFCKSEAEDIFRDFDKRIIKITMEEIEKELIETESSETKIEDDMKVIDEINKMKGIFKPKKETTTKTTRRKREKIDPNRDITTFDPIVLAFDQQMADFRKKWLQNYNKQNIIKEMSGNLDVGDFINKELIHFSNYDNIRSIPMIDGFKPSQRKVLYTCLKKKLYHEMKVAQLACSVAEITEYHHGEASLQGTIVNLAQDFVGTNNINLLVPCGQFGTRLTGGMMGPKSDVASARYIFTMLSDVTKKIFREEDEYVYNYLIEENKLIEPECFAPIIPTILINGATGIGTGFSVNIPCYNPIDILNNLRKLITKKIMINMTPWYQGFKGSIEKIDATSYHTYGIFELVDENTVKIKELPIGTWTNKYIEFLKQISQFDKQLEEKHILSHYDDNSNSDNIDITVTFIDGKLIELIKQNSLMSELKLISVLKTSNMNLCDENGVVKHYNTTHDLLTYFYEFRYEWYEKRKEYYLKLLKNQLDFIYYRKLFIEYVVNKKIIIEKRQKFDIIKDIEQNKFPKLSTNINATEDEKNYKYLVDLPLFSLTLEKISEYEFEFEQKKNEYEIYFKKTIENIWLEELDEFEVSYNKFIDDKTLFDKKTNNSLKQKHIKKTK